MQGDFIVAGDLNSKALEWGEARPISRGRRTLEVASRLELSVLNKGSTSSFRRPGYRETIPDVSLANEHHVARVACWQVIEDYTGGDHQYIPFDRSEHAAHPKGLCDSGAKEWHETAETPCIFVGERDCRSSQKVLKATPFSTTSEETRPRRCSLAADYQAAKKVLKRTIKARLRRCWKELCLDVVQNPWGLGYFIVTRKLGTNTQVSPQDARTLDHIVHTLFPSQPKREISLDAPCIIKVPQFTEEELLRFVSSMRSKKAPGPDGLPAEIIKVVAQSHPELLLNMYNTCLSGCIFPAPWKKARLVLISKGKGPVGAASSYRPTCMLDTAENLLKKLLMPRLHAAVKAARDVAARQYGFRFCLSTIHAVLEVVTAAKMFERGNHRTRSLCLLATLDVRNAFNSVRSDLAREALELYNTSDGPRSLELTSGSAVVSILGPDIWNIFYYGIFRMAVPEGTFLVGYADDIAVVITVGQETRRGTVAAQPDHAESYLLDGRPWAITSSPEGRDRANYEEAHQHIAQLHCGKRSSLNGHAHGQCQWSPAVHEESTDACRRSSNVVRCRSMGQGAAKTGIEQAHSRGTEEGRPPNRVLLPHGLRAGSDSCRRCNPDRSICPGEEIRLPAKVCPGKGEIIKARQVYQHQGLAKYLGAVT
ncbi:uncharacterized protein LOC118448395 [Vespa mandarinia]|uniref:uncharacterized protein LOC118448395 n=1 Tax=Vespa mandarinia TaxID=7446 RepID=UPI001613BF06|nr:uncharacterized protein LOC118448395 [Vespa mandarinia]